MDEMDFSDWSLEGFKECIDLFSENIMKSYERAMHMAAYATDIKLSKRCPENLSNALAMHIAKTTKLRLALDEVLAENVRLTYAVKKEEEEI